MNPNSQYFVPVCLASVVEPAPLVAVIVKNSTLGGILLPLKTNIQSIKIFLKLHLDFHTLCIPKMPGN